MGWLRCACTATSGAIRRTTSAAQVLTGVKYARIQQTATHIGGRGAGNCRRKPSQGWCMARVTTTTGSVGLAIAAGLLLATVAVPRAQAPSAAATTAAPTFTKDVLPIVQRSCQKCHRPNTSAPMSLLTYQ